MSTTIAWTLRCRVKAGTVDELCSLVHDLVASSEEEPGTQRYEWFVDDDATTAHIYERYADSAAALAHLETFGEQFAERFSARANPMDFVVYGDPTGPLRDALEAFNPTYMRQLGGFARSS
jgi:quinol monooxygenase YgiN